MRASPRSCAIPSHLTEPNTDSAIDTILRFFSMCLKRIFWRIIFRRTVKQSSDVAANDLCAPDTDANPTSGELPSIGAVNSISACTPAHPDTESVSSQPVLLHSNTCHELYSPLEIATHAENATVDLFDAAPSLGTSPFCINKDLPSRPSDFMADEEHEQEESIRSDSQSLDTSTSPASSYSNPELTSVDSEPGDQLRLPQARDLLALIRPLCLTIEGLNELILVAQMAKDMIAELYPHHPLADKIVPQSIKIRAIPEFNPLLLPLSPLDLDENTPPRHLDEVVTEAMGDKCSTVSPPRALDDVPGLPHDEDVRTDLNKHSANIHLDLSLETTSHNEDSIVFDPQVLEDLQDLINYQGIFPVDDTRYLAADTNSSLSTSPARRSNSMDECLSTPRAEAFSIDDPFSVQVHDQSDISRAATIHEFRHEQMVFKGESDADAVAFDPLRCPPPPNTIASLSPEITLAEIDALSADPSLVQDDSVDSPVPLSRTPEIETQPIMKQIAGGGCARVYYVKSADSTEGENDDLAMKAIDLKEYTVSGLKDCAREVQILKLLHDKQRDSSGKADEDAREYVMKFPSRPVENCIWAEQEAGTLSIFTEYYPYDLWQFRGARVSQPGAGLGERISEHKESLFFIIHDITRGLNYIHSLGIVHLDIKPSNILLTESRHCVIGDFGGSVYEPGPRGKQVDSSTRSYITRAFAAPELVDRPTFDYRADFWSLGLTMFDLVVPDGLAALLGGDPCDEDVRNARHTDYDKILARRKTDGMMHQKGCSRDVIDIVLNMLQRDPGNRRSGKSIMKYLKEAGWTDKFGLSNPSPLLKYEPTPRHVISSDGAANKLQNLTADEATYRFRQEVVSLCGYEIPLVS